MVVSASLKVHTSPEYPTIVPFRTLLLWEVAALVMVVWWWRKGAGDEADVRNEINPTYGLYYFDDGNRIDDSNSEVVDGNIYYQL